LSASGEPPPRSDPARRRSWADLGPRLLSALVLLAVTVLTLVLGGYVFAVVVGAVFAGVYREWETMVARTALSVAGMVMIGLVAVAGAVYPLTGPIGTLACIAAAMGIAIGFGGEGRLWRLVGLAFTGAVLIGVLAMRGTAYDGIEAGIFLGTVVWMTDSAAFFAGRQIGGEKLAPDISPSKTWSGALGGLALGTVAGTLIWVLLTASPWWIGALLSAILSILGQLGDLAESAVKRHFRVKDSGDIIPGHGGLMDRLDSLTFAVLFLFGVGLVRGGFDGVAPGFLNW
jgi:phosphatidate cytidylyltransferase